MGNAYGLESQCSPSSCGASIAVDVIPAQDQNGGEEKLGDDEATAHTARGGDGDNTAADRYACGYVCSDVGGVDAPN